MKNIILFAYCLFFSQITFTQSVWPGDVNNNGVVNEVDLLYLGLAFGETGTPRATVDSSWTAQEIVTNWTGNFPEGINFAYADCNGDGIINEADADVIERNYLQTNDVPSIPDEILEAIAGEDPEITFLTQDLIVPEGGSIDLDIGLGTADIGVDSILGLAFTIKVDPLLFQGNRIQFKFDKNSWLNPDDEFSLTKKLKQNPKENGLFTLAFVRKNKMPVSGFGSLGTISFVVETDITALIIANDNFTVEIDSVIMVDEGLEQLPALGGSINLQLEELIDSTTSTYNPILDEIKVFPNPTSGWILVKTANIQTEHFEVYNTLGQKIFSQQGTANNFQSLDLQHIPKGSYWLRCYTEYGLKQEHIQKF